MHKKAHRLVLHRETLRRLTGHELIRVRGGGDLAELIDQLGDGGNDDPKTNAWTGAMQRLGGQRVC